jgi:hypothetical protein
MNQLVVGAAVPFLAAVLVYLARRGRAGLRMLIVTPLLMGLGALWAVVPDVPRLLGMPGLYSRLARDPRTDIFFWHYTIDRLETDSTVYNAAMALMLAALVAAAWRELRSAETSPDRKRKDNR